MSRLRKVIYLRQTYSGESGSGTVSPPTDEWEWQDGEIHDWQDNNIAEWYESTDMSSQYVGWEDGADMTWEDDAIIQWED